MGRKILVVGDNHGIDPSILEALEAMEADLDVAQNPVAAYPKLWKCTYDLVVAEMGTDVAKQEEVLKVLWQARKGCPRAEIVIVADLCGPQLAKHAQELGAAFCLRKETAPDMLIKTLHSLGIESRAAGPGGCGA